MARYIDADKLIAHLKDEIKECEIPFGSRANGKSIAYGTALGLKSAISFAETLSTADVVPKSEVENSMPVDVSEALKQRAVEKAKAEVAREIFEDTENNYADFLFDGYRNIIVLTEKDFAELKKKYTEGDDGNQQ